LEKARAGDTPDMLTILLLVLIVVLLFGGGGYYYRGRGRV
jgi:flagellar basal body-associated protein FliL